MRIGQHMYSAAAYVAKGLTNLYAALAKRIASSLKKRDSDAQSIQGKPLEGAASFPAVIKKDNNLAKIALVAQEYANLGDTPQKDAPSQNETREQVLKLNERGEKLTTVDQNLSSSNARLEKANDTDLSNGGKIKKSKVKNHAKKEKLFDQNDSKEIRQFGGKIRDDKGNIVSYTYKGVTIPKDLLSD